MKPIPAVQGHLAGLAPAEKRRLERLYRRRVPARQIVHQELARELAQLSADLNRRIGLLVDRAGRIEKISVGSAEAITVPREPSAPSGRMRFCTLRFITTRFSESELTTAELAPLALHRLDALAVLSVSDDGQLGDARVAHLLPAPEGSAATQPAPDLEAEPRPVPGRRGRSRRLSEDVSEHGQRYRLFSPREVAKLDDDFLELIRALEREFDRVRDRTKIAGKAGRAILVHVTTGSRAAAEQSMAELCELAESDELHIIKRVVQRRASYDPKTLMGAGKLQDLIFDSLQHQIDYLIVDQNLTPAQARAIAQATDLKVLDRTQLILDIFARRARTREGKIQVELAQLKYLLPRLSSRGDSGLSRLTGGIGGRGPGEQKLEIDRRRVRDRIRALEKQLINERKRREQRRSRRRQREVPVISLVGYTNAGKSTLLNLLTDSEVFTEHLMFATLDPTSRRLRLPREREVVINDTVGFIRDLPKDLIAAFRATLEEIEDSDLIVHLVDLSHPRYLAQVQAVEKILSDLDFDELPLIRVGNKIDAVPPDELEGRLSDIDGFGISAIEKIGIDRLLSAIDRALPIELASAVPGRRVQRPSAPSAPAAGEDSDAALATTNHADEAGAEDASEPLEETYGDASIDEAVG